jgi:hypothetical protein
VHRSSSFAARAGALALGLALGAAPAAAQPRNAGVEYGRGALCVLANLIYGPVKLLYATGGALVAGGAYVFSGGDRDVTGPIADASLRGTYAITPRHLTGAERIEFVGRSPSQRAAKERADGDWGGAPPDEGF